MRTKEFKKGAPKPKKVIDSRFGLRKFFTTSKEKPTAGVYNTAGRGPNGEHQN